MDSFLLQNLLNGLFLGSLYALVGSQLALMFGVTRLINFAHAEFFTLGAYMTFALAGTLGLSYYLCGVIVPFVMFFCGIAFYYVIIRPASKKHWLMAVISTFAISVIIQNGLLMVFGPSPLSYQGPQYLIRIPIGTPYPFISLERALVVIAAISSFALLQLFVSRTMIGKAMRAVSQNKEGCQVVGIRTDRVSAVAVGISLSLAAVAGTLSTPIYILQPFMGLSLLFKCFAVICIGGFGNVKGALVGAYILGFTEALFTAYVSGTWKEVIAFGLIVVFLLFRPDGLFGKRVGL
jgi:branched-chain amino acid transport system permease protein